MKNNVIVILLVILIGILSGGALLFGIGQAVQVANVPLIEKMGEIISEQKITERKVAELDHKFEILNTNLTNFAKKIGGGNQPQAPQGQQEDFDKVYEIPVGASAIMGAENAPVTIVKFTDLQCPFCSRFYGPLKDTLAAYPGKVRLILKNFPLPFHPNALPAAKLSLAAKEQGKYIEMVEQLLANGADVSEAKVKEYAAKTGVNYDKLMADVKANDARYDQQIKDETELGHNVDVRGTPTFFINGKKTMARDLNGFKAEVDKILAQK